MSPKQSADDLPYTLPATGFVRQSQLKGIIPFSAATFWRKVKDGSFPAPVKLSAGVTAWRVEEIRAWMQPIHSTQIPPVPAPIPFPSSAPGGGHQDTAPTVQRRPNARESRPATASEKRLERQLMTEATAWREADTLRGYITHILGTVVASGGKPSSEFSAWLVQAMRVADRLDPTQTRMTDAIVEYIRAGMVEPK